MKLTASEINEQRFLELEAKINKNKGAKQLERWFAYSKKGSVICPICLSLDKLGWVDFGLLPAFKKAHSVIGQGDWRVGDEHCNCSKGYKRVAGSAPKNIIPIGGYDSPNSIKRPKLKFDEEPKYTTEEVIEKLRLMKIEFRKCTCK